MKLTHEDGHIVLRDEKGYLVWSKHLCDLDSPTDHVEFIGEIKEKINDGSIKTTLIKQFRGVGEPDPASHSCNEIEISVSYESNLYSQLKSIM